jgi:hypothetical protein
VPSIGLALANLFTDPTALEAAKNKYVYISSVQTTQLEILAALKKVSAEKWTVTQVSSKELLVQAKEKLARGDGSGRQKGGTKCLV